MEFSRSENCLDKPPLKGEGDRLRWTGYAPSLLAANPSPLRAELAAFFEWRKDFMSLEMLKDECRYEGELRGVAKGRMEGRKEGLLKGMWSLVNSGIISSAVAAQQCSMTEEAFLKTKPQAV